MLTQCYDKCLAKYKLFVNSKVRKALFTTPRTMKSKCVDITTIVVKTRFVVVTPLIAKDKDSSASRSTSLFEKVRKLSNYMRTKASRKWQKWFERQPNFSCSHKSVTARTTPCVTKGRDNVVSHSRTPIPVKKWIAKPSTLPYVFSPCIEGLGHNLFSVGQFCDGDLEVAFRSKHVMFAIWKEKIF
ncbi:hypothetical protein Tco_1568327 [Tanacetum coccineum]